MNNFECLACGETINERRRSQHEEFWCEAIIIPDDEENNDNDDDDDKDQNGEDSGCEQQQPVSMAALKVAVQDLGDLNTKVHKITSVQLSSGLALSFEELSVFASDTSTGGALWKSELLLAEWMIQEVTTNTKDDDDTPSIINSRSNLVVVELGCGACPAAGMTAAAMGYGQSIMTDRPEVVKLAEVNLRRNIENISKARRRIMIQQTMGESTQLSAPSLSSSSPSPSLPSPSSSSSSSPSPSPSPLPPLGRNNFDTAVFEWGVNVETNSILPDRLSSLTAIHIILISDCIFSKKTHTKLLQAITQLLVYHRFNNKSNNTNANTNTNTSTQQPKIILAYQRRGGTEEDEFFRRAKQDFGLVPIPVDNASGLKAKLDGSTDGLEICQLVVVVAGAVSPLVPKLQSKKERYCIEPLPDTPPKTTTKKTASANITAISWTGGKDCNLTLLYAHRDPNLDVQYLLTFCFEGNNSRAHPLPFMEAQAKSLNLELLYVNIPENTTDYMQAYVDGIRNIKQKYGVTVIGTGDMDLVGMMERNWIEQCCEQVGEGMEVYLPLWTKDRTEALHEILHEKFDIIFSCVKSPFFDGTWIHRSLDATAVKEMEGIIEQGLTKEQLEKGIKPLDLCGERGEYHTMCVDGPLYHHKVEMVVNNDPIREDLTKGTTWKGNIHNANSIWTISLQN